MYFYDSAKKEMVEFKPINSNRVKIYVCGPTVYDDAHLGHARSAIVFDILRRFLIEAGYQVTFMKNFTDIDDKIVKKVFSTNLSFEKITSKYTQSYLNDMKALNVLEADITPFATKTLDKIFETIEILLQKGYAYKTEKNDIYFDTSKDKDYCQLSKKCSEETLCRIEPNPYKKNCSDFALWKNCKEKDICFDSPFGKGRPGWHIECSAMIYKYLAYKNSEYQIDIHGGGKDLFFPHHENEAAQTRAAFGQKLAKYWLHNGFVKISGEKMSKSLGNSFFVKDALKKYDGEILRFYLLSTHYRADFNFNEEDLLSAKKRLDKLYRLKKRIHTSKEIEDDTFKKRFLSGLEEDLNISKALAIIDEFITKTNEALNSNPKNKQIKAKANYFLKIINRVLGIGEKEPYVYFQTGVGSKEKKLIENLIDERKKAKEEKNFKKADEIRAKLKKMGIAVMDTPQGTIWEKV
jgi:cysteinyl-tRNA synthetase